MEKDIELLDKLLITYDLNISDCIKIYIGKDGDTEIRLNSTIYSGKNISECISNIRESLVDFFLDHIQSENNKIIEKASLSLEAFFMT